MSRRLDRARAKSGLVFRDGRLINVSELQPKVPQKDITPEMIAQDRKPIE